MGEGFLQESSALQLLLKTLGRLCGLSREVILHDLPLQFIQSRARQWLVQGEKEANSWLPEKK